MALYLATKQNKTPTQKLTRAVQTRVVHGSTAVSTEMRLKKYQGKQVF